jgi:vacuolar-type H+-ATPase subunit I/STV1
MKPEPMAKIHVLCTRKHLRKVIRTLHDMKVLHIVDHKKGELDIGTPLDESAMISEILVKVRGIIAFLKIDTERKADEAEFRKFVNKRGLTDLHTVGKTTEKPQEDHRGDRDTEGLACPA